MNGYTDADRAQAKEIGDAIQRTATVDFEDGTLLLRWVVVADWVSPDGTRQLSRICPEETAIWEAKGLLHAGIEDWAEE